MSSAKSRSFTHFAECLVDLLRRVNRPMLALLMVAWHDNKEKLGEDVHWTNTGGYFKAFGQMAIN